MPFCPFSCPVFLSGPCQRWWDLGLSQLGATMVVLDLGIGGSFSLEDSLQRGEGFCCVSVTVYHIPTFHFFLDTPPPTENRARLEFSHKVFNLSRSIQGQLSS